MIALCYRQHLDESYETSLELKKEEKENEEEEKQRERITAAFERKKKLTVSRRAKHTRLVYLTGAGLSSGDESGKDGRKAAICFPRV